ncbi:malonic semialdehyde reductase [Aurantiacibacter sp. MUD61]|uniref:malonic semialdehyde reductase n=1 Tax=Aurantiacibacter sp. MUD61 TaxID=3009083 RepID=UPI0022F06A66|nr:malonic semialdehyde reductase [Aurantiacibacter sp. MUD61]
MSDTLSDSALDLIFRDARSYNGWLDKDVSREQIEAIYDLMKMGPTSANQQPGRFVWVTTPEAKQRLADCADEGNKEKILGAPATVIIGYDLDFHEQLPWLFPHTDAKSWFEGKVEGRKESAFRNSVLQGAYLMIAARALGLDCGPMSGFDPEKTTKEFFADQPRYTADWLCAIGYGDPDSIFDRSPRPEFDTFNKVI